MPESDRIGVESVTTGRETLLAAARLAEQGVPFALATVVSVIAPASAHRGDRGLVTADGRLHGWVGGACSEPIVIREALRAIEAGEARLVRIAPAERLDGAPEGVVCAESTCASEGVVEVLIEPELPAPLVAIVGESPAARTLGELARTIGWRTSATIAPDATAVVVATMGRGDEDALREAVATPAGYIGLVASSRRASAVTRAMREEGVAEDALARIHAPAGLDLGSASQVEIAVAILAQIVAWRNTRPRQSIDAATLGEAIDPVCGMSVPAGGQTPSAEHDGITYYFCCPGCRGRFVRAPARFLSVES